MDSKRTKAFKSLFNNLPDNIKESARKQYKVFLENQSHPSLRRKQVGSTRNNRFKVYEVTICMGYRATYFRDEDVYVWFWIGTHDSFDKRY
ncbi:MAG: hypothetical protein EHM85_05615 [Desulfobacteraceae bacterium]|nr:MAG: hypothetical protein EHM85_05615 [Desulfobacteraceae bacterium]